MPSVCVVTANKKPLSPLDYRPQSVTRACAKVWLGNLCRRDWNGRPEITCIITCDKDLCNCASRSPPPEMFRKGLALPESPKRSTYKDTDLLSCKAMAGVPGYGGERVDNMDNDYDYYNQMAWDRRRRNRQSRRMRNSAITTHGVSYITSVAIVVLTVYCATHGHHP